MQHFNIAHFSDIHLPPLPKPKVGELFGIRLVGYLSWRLNRHKIHSQKVLHAFEADVKTQNIDHFAFSGDLVNIAAKKEIANAVTWLKNFASPKMLSFVPGNHDAYTKTGLEQLLCEVSDYIQPCAKGREILDTLEIELGDEHAFDRFPYIRIFGKIALIGVSSAIATQPFMATGETGYKQRERLSKILKYLKENGYFRMMMIHHPPLPRLTSNKRALIDCAEMKDILTDVGAEIILYGHNHKNKFTNISNQYGPSIAIGVASATTLKTAHKPAASYNQIIIDETKKGWQVNLLKREYAATSNTFEEKEVTPLGFWHF